MKSLFKQKLLSMNISLGNGETFVKKIIELGKMKNSSYVCVANVHMCIETYRNSEFAAIVNHSDITTPDSMPLIKALKWIHGVDQEKVSGPDLMPKVLAAAEKEGQRVYFYGSTPSILEKLDTYCMDHYPNLSIAGVYSPPFRKLSDAELQEDADRINESGANIVFVALGCPKQERWMASMKGKINAAMIGVGGAFPILVGVEKRAPLWMQNNSLEWFYRLIQNPQRLFKRYLVTNTSFLYLIFREKLKYVR